MASTSTSVLTSQSASASTVASTSASASTSNSTRTAPFDNLPSGVTYNVTYNVYEEAELKTLSDRFKNVFAQPVQGKINSDGTVTLTMSVTETVKGLTFNGKSATPNANKSVWTITIPKSEMSNVIKANIVLNYFGFDRYFDFYSFTNPTTKQTVLIPK
ncbi:hypothetical protein [Eupransor demetentiae]|uniref:hypothetical protein n=1 Tax=Eupransor demetentiae TaxID=3109584 RepID=UPI0032E36658